RSGSPNAWKTFCQTPARSQRANRRQMVFHFPYRSGRSRQGTLVRATYTTASTNRRGSFCAPAVGRRSFTRSQSASVIAYRGSTVDHPQGETSDLIGGRGLPVRGTAAG